MGLSTIARKEVLLNPQVLFIEAWKIRPLDGLGKYEIGWPLCVNCMDQISKYPWRVCRTFLQLPALKEETELWWDCQKSALDWFAVLPSRSQSRFFEHFVRALSGVYTSNLSNDSDFYLGQILSLYEAKYFGQIFSQTFCFIEGQYLAQIKF